MKKTWTMVAMALIVSLMLVVAGCGGGSTPAKAPEAPKFPTKQIEIIVPAGAGGGTDMLARALANKAKDLLGQPVVIVNKPGGSGTVGFTAGQTAKPDGYTVTMFFAEIVIVPHLGIAQADHKLFVPIMRVNMDPAAITVNASGPPRPGPLKTEPPASGDPSGRSWWIVTKVAPGGVWARIQR